jgi:3D (Asp-Asp-Asp) domain-containing protein
LLLAAVFSGVLAAGVLPASGAVSSPGTRPHLNTLRARRATIETRTHAALLDLYSAQARLRGAQAELRSIRSRSATLTAEMATVRREAMVTRQSLTVSRKRIARLLRAIYVEGDVDPVAVILGAESLDAALTGIDSLQRAAALDRQLAEQARSRELRLEELQTRLQTDALSLKRAEALTTTTVANIGAAAETRAATVTSLRRKGELTRTQISALEQRAGAAAKRSAELGAPARATGQGAGTAAPQTRVQTPQPQSGHSYTLTVAAVAYHLPGRTASGLPVGVGVVAVDPTVIPLGTRMYIPGYGPGIAADVGTAVKGRIIDLWMPTTAAAQEWGRQTLTITIYR